MMNKIKRLSQFTLRFHLVNPVNPVEGMMESNNFA